MNADSGYSTPRTWNRMRVRRVYYHTLVRLGGYARFQRIDWGSVQRLVFCCMGNICRSPYAEMSARRRGLEALSAGTNAKPGSPAEPTAIRRAAARGIDLEIHASRRVDALALYATDLVVVMEPRNLTAVSDFLPDNVQVTFLTLWAQRPTVFLPDPYGGGAQTFDRCFAVIDESLDGIEGNLNFAPSTGDREAGEVKPALGAPVANGEPRR